MPKNLVFVRHGESQANILLEKIKDSVLLTEESVTLPDRTWALTEEGERQAAVLGNEFKNGGELNFDFDHYYVSPYVRTRQTASQLNIENALWEPLREIRERSWGEINSIPTAVFKHEYARNYELHKVDPLYWTPPGGESLASVAEGRLNAFFAKLHRDNAGENVICVTHHDIMLGAKLVLEHLSDEMFTTGLENKSLMFPNASALCYTRKDPVTGVLHPKFKYVKLVSINKQTQVVTKGWEEISKIKYTNQELLKL